MKLESPCEAQSPEIIVKAQERDFTGYDGDFTIEVDNGPVGQGGPAVVPPPPPPQP